MHFAQIAEPADVCRTTYELGTHRAIQNLEISVKRLRGLLQPQGAPSFAFQEWVEFGSELTRTPYAHLYDETVSIRFGGGAQHYLGRFIAPYDSSHWVIEARLAHTSAAKNNFPWTPLIIPARDVTRLPSGTVQNLQIHLKELLDTRTQFEANEVVRFRNQEGYLELGRLERSPPQGDRLQILDPQGHLIEVPSQSVFRLNSKQKGGGVPTTSIFNADWIGPKMTAPKGSLRLFLDGAGRLTSLSDFVNLTPYHQINSLLWYLKPLVAWRPGALCAELAGLENFEDIVTSGAGVCRHQAVLLATLLREAGYVARLVFYLPSTGEAGHAWIEVDLPDSNGSLKATQTFVVDPSEHPALIAFKEAQRDAARHRGSIAARFYTQPGRQVLLPENLKRGLN
jgi:hypothetical protein